MEIAFAKALSFELVVHNEIEGVSEDCFFKVGKS
jgi:hypothetical protein